MAGIVRLSPVWTLCLVVGCYGALLGWRDGAFVMLAAVIGSIGSHLAVGVLMYRSVMTRPWPKVAPLPEDDEW